MASRCPSGNRSRSNARRSAGNHDVSKPNRSHMSRQISVSVFTSPGGSNSFARALHVGMPVRRADVLLLEQRLRGKHVVGESRRVRHELIDDDQEVEAREGVADAGASAGSGWPGCRARSRPRARGGAPAPRVPGRAATRGSPRTPGGSGGSGGSARHVAREVGVLPAAAGDADVARERGQQRYGSHRLAAVVVALQAEARDEQRRALRARTREPGRGWRLLGTPVIVGDALERVFGEPREVARRSRCACAARNAGSWSPASTIARATPSARAASVPGRGCRCTIGRVGRVRAARIDDRHAAPRVPAPRGPAATGGCWFRPGCGPRAGRSGFRSSGADGCAGSRRTSAASPRGRPASRGRRRSVVQPPNCRQKAIARPPSAPCYPSLVVERGLRSRGAPHAVESCRDVTKRHVPGHRFEPAIAAAPERVSRRSGRATRRRA